MRRLSPDLPLALRLLLVAVPLLAAMAGFGTGHVAWSVVLGLLAAWLFNRLFIAV